MKKILLLAVLFGFVSCKSLKEEFQPVVNWKYDNPDKIPAVSGITANTTIAELVSRYEVGKPWVIDENIIISGIVSTTDQPGNFYKSFYIQDETGGIELKLGKNGLYNDYLPGQRIYVKCEGLCLGMYGYKGGAYGGYGMVQLGFSDPSGEYETSYIDNSLIIDSHIFKGEIGERVSPVVLSDSQLPGGTATQSTNNNIGKLVTIKDLTFGHANGITFALLYLDSTKNKKDATNRIFITGLNTGITTWAMSKEKMTEYIKSGIWDSFQVGSGNELYEKVGEHRGDGTYPTIQKDAYAVSQYFHAPSGKCIQIRTSGYSKFADAEIDPDVLDYKKKINVTGILTLYQGSIQITVNDITDIETQ